MTRKLRLGGVLVRFSPFDRLHFLRQRPGEDFIDMPDRDDFNAVLHGRWDFDEILLILFRDQHHRNAPPKSREQLFFQTADGEHMSTKRDLAGHRHVAPDRNAGKRRDHRRHHSDAG